MASLFSQFFFGLCGPVQGFRVRHASTQELLLEVPPNERAADFAALGLADGDYPLEVTYVDAYGCESLPAKYRLNLIGSNASQGLAYITQGRVDPRADGNVAVYLFISNPDNALLRPAAIEFARAETPEAVLETQTLDRAVQGNINSSLGPFAHGETVRLRARTSDGAPGGRRSEWFDLPAFVADTEGPPTPQILVPVEPCCG